MNSNTIAVMPQTSPSGNVTAETAFGLAPGNTVRAFVSLPPPIGNQGADAREYVLRAAFLVTTGGAFTYAPSIRLYSGGNTALTTFTNDTAIITPTPPTISTTTRLIVIRAEIQWDPSGGASSRLNGRYTWNVDSTQTNWVTLTAGLSAGVASEAAIQFCITGFFGTGNASNQAILKYFEIDAV